MKLLILAVLLAMFLAPHVYAEEKPFVRVQITYIDTPVLDGSRHSLMPALNRPTGDALSEFKHALELQNVRYHVTPGPELVADDGVFASIDKMHIKFVTRTGVRNTSILVGPALVITPTVIESDLVSVELTITDKEIVGPDSDWLKESEFVDATGPPFFLAHNGSTVCLGGVFHSADIERFTFATVAVLPTKPQGDVANKHPVTNPSATDLPDRAIKASTHVVSKFVSTSPHRWPALDVRITDAVVPADMVDAVKSAMSDHTGRQRRLLVLSKDAISKGQTFVIIHGVRGMNIPRSKGGIEPIDSDKLSRPSVSKETFIVPFRNSQPTVTGISDTRIKARLTQTLTFAGRIDPDRTATINLTLNEKMSSAPDKKGRVFTQYSHRYGVKSMNFLDGETDAIYNEPRSDGTQFLIFATVTILPPTKD